MLVGDLRVCDKADMTHLRPVASGEMAQVPKDEACRLCWCLRRKSRKFIRSSMLMSGSPLGTGDIPGTG